MCLPQSGALDRSLQAAAPVAGPSADLHPPAAALTQCRASGQTTSAAHEKSRPEAAFFMYLAERGGFEPPRRYKRLPDFESGTFNRSATSPDGPGEPGCE